MSKVRAVFSRVAVLAAVLLTVGCAGDPPPKENLLTRAGFRSMPANNPTKLALLKPLKVGEVTPVLFGQRYYYVVREEKRDAVLVGGPVEMRVYENSLRRRGLPTDRLTPKELEKPADWTAWRGLNDGWYTLAL